MKVTKAASSTVVDALEAVQVAASVTKQVLQQANLAAETALLASLIEAESDIRALCEEHDISREELDQLYKKRFGTTDDKPKRKSK